MTTRLVGYLSLLAASAVLVAASACTGSTSTPGDPGDGPPDAGIADGGLPGPGPDGAVLDGGALPDAAVPPDAPSPADVIVADTTSLDIGGIEIGHQGTANVVLTNHGTANVAINTAAITTGGQFQIAGFDCPASLAPNETCTVSVLFAPIHVGATTSALVVPTSANTVQLPVHGTGQRRITVSQIGNGAGAVFSTPGGIDCPRICTALFSTDAVLTATPLPTNVFAGWSPICDGRTTCTVPAEDAALDVNAAFDVAAGPTHRVTVDVAGGSLGLTFILSFTATGSDFIKCTTSPCTLDVPDRADVELWGFTPSTFAGWSDGCVSTDNLCPLGPVTGDVTATVHYDRDEHELTTIFPRAAVISVAFASDGGLLVADNLGVSKLALTGAQVWTTPITGGASHLAVDNAGNVYGRGGGGAVFSLAPTGSVRWNRSAPTLSFTSVQSLLQVTPDGTRVAVPSFDGARVLDGATGADRLAISSLTGPFDGFALAPDGTIAIGTASASQPEFQIDIHRFSSTGAVLPTLENVATNLSLTFDAGNALCLLSVAGRGQTVSRTLPDLTTVFTTSSDTDARNPPGAIAVDTAGNIVAARGSNQALRSSGLHLEVFTPTGTQTFVHDKPGIDAPNIILADSVQLQALAADRHARRFAVGGVYNTDQPWIQVYEMPTP